MFTADHSEAESSCETEAGIDGPSDPELEDGEELSDSLPNSKSRKFACRINRFKKQIPSWCVKGLAEIQTEEVYIYIIHDCSRAKQTLAHTHLHTHTHTHLNLTCKTTAKTWLSEPHERGEPASGNKTSGTVGYGDTSLVTPVACPPWCSRGTHLWACKTHEMREVGYGPERQHQSIRPVLLAVEFHTHTHTHTHRPIFH